MDSYTVKFTRETQNSHEAEVEPRHRITRYIFGFFRFSWLAQQIGTCLLDWTKHHPVLFRLSTHRTKSYSKDFVSPLRRAGIWAAIFFTASCACDLPLRARSRSHDERATPCQSDALVDSCPLPCCVYIHSSKTFVPRLPSDSVVLHLHSFFIFLCVFFLTRVFNAECFIILSMPFFIVYYLLQVLR